MAKSMVVTISAKCSDLFAAHLTNGKGEQIGEDYDGYVPDWFPDRHYGDYVMLDIEIETGKILNWRAPTVDELAETFKVPE
jgi:hypothetical protein